MMKKYVIMNPLLAGMGGGQMYTRNKILYLENQGWETDVIYASQGKILIKELQKYDSVFPELIFPMHYFSKKKCEKIVNSIANKIKDDKYEEIIVESTYFATSTWAEAVSARIGAKHYVYLLQEENLVRNRSLLDFLIFKYQRKELASITDTSLQQMFSSYYPISKETSYWLPAYCNNVEADVDSPWIDAVDKTKYDYVVGSLGRLEKPYLQHALIDFGNYAKSHSDKKFLLLVMGGAPSLNDVIAKIKSTITDIAKNVDIIFTGYLYPIPIRLLDKCDAFFSSAGSSWLCKKSGVPTISYDGNDYRPIGILGRTTMHSLFREDNEPVQDFNELMNFILIKNKFPKEPSSYDSHQPDFSGHLEFLKDSCSVKEYYDIDKIVSESFDEKWLSIKLKIVGASFYYQLSLRKNKS